MDIFLQKPTQFHICWLWKVITFCFVICFVKQSQSHEAVEISVHPEKSKVEDHGAASFYCETNLGGAPVIYWRRNGRRVSIGGNYDIFRTWGGSILRIQPVRFKRDDALFECVVDDPNGEAVSAAAQLMVYPKWLRPNGYPRIIDSDTMRMVEEYDVIELVCVVEGDPKPNVTWVKDYIPIDVDYRHTILEEGNLMIAYVNDDDEGIYECVAENDLGIAYSKPARIILEENDY